MPLIMVGIGETCTIQRIGGSEETRRFLSNLGFVQGAEVTVLSAISYIFWLTYVAVKRSKPKNPKKDAPKD